MKANPRNWKLFVSIATISAVVFGISYYVPEITSYSFQVSMALIGFVIFYLIDKYAVPEFDTFTQIAKGNVAAGLYFLGTCILIAAATLAASAGFSLIRP